MKKVAYNACFGGFCLSEDAAKLGRKLSGNDKWARIHIPGERYEDGSKVEDFYGFIEGISRHDPILVQVIETLGEKASGMCSRLRIAEIEESQYRIDEYDGRESVETRDSYDWVTI